jgi:hypothetical protein
MGHQGSLLDRCRKIANSGPARKKHGNASSAGTFGAMTAVSLMFLNACRADWQRAASRRPGADERQFVMT